MEREALARAQAAMLEHLERAPDGSAARDALLADPRLAPLRDWIAAADPRMLGVAADLVRRWGHKDAGV